MTDDLQALSDAATDDLRRLSSEATPGPWVVQGSMFSGPDKGGIDIGPLIGETFERENDAAYIVALVNAHRETLAATPVAPAPGWEVREGELAASPSPDTDRDEPCGRCGTWRRFHGYGEVQGPEYSRDHSWEPSPATDAGLDAWVQRYFERLDHIRATNDPDEQAQYGAGVELAEREIRARLASVTSETGGPE